MKIKELEKWEYLTIAKIAKRAKEFADFDHLTLMMNLEHVHKEVGLRLHDLLKADNFNFIHDVFEINANINRNTGKLDNCFLPRFTRI